MRYERFEGFLWVVLMLGCSGVGRACEGSICVGKT